MIIYMMEIREKIGSSGPDTDADADADADADTA